MNKFGGKISFILFLLVFLTSSCEQVIIGKKDYKFLLEQTETNKAELINILNSYGQTQDREKALAIEFLLDHIVDQYWIDYKMIKKDSSISLNSSISIDSILVLQNKGFLIDQRDTIKDIDVIRSSDLESHVDQFLSNWKSKRFTSDLSFSDYMKLVLPYRINNEPLSACFSKMTIRYPLDKLIRQKAFKDTIDAYAMKVTSIFDDHSKNLYGVNHLNVVDDIEILSGKNQIKDYEDYHIYRSNMLKYQGIPVFTQFTAHTRNLSARPYTTKYVDKGFSLDSLCYKNVAKVYMSSFSKSDWHNPFDELIKLGIQLKDIPLSMNIPKMKDVTSRVTKVGSIKENFLFPKYKNGSETIFYLCSYTSGTWMPIDYSVFRRGKLDLNDIGLNVLYIFARYSNGNLRFASDPFVLQDSGVHLFKSNAENRQLNKLKESNSKELQPGQDYLLFQWTENGWREKKKVNNYINSVNISEGAIYSLRKVGDKIGKNSRPFSIRNEEQIWW